MHKVSTETPTAVVSSLESEPTQILVFPFYIFASSNVPVSLNYSQELRRVKKVRKLQLLRTNHIHRDWLIDICRRGFRQCLCSEDITVIKKDPLNPHPHHNICYSTYQEKLDTPEEYCARASPSVNIMQGKQEDLSRPVCRALLTRRRWQNVGIPLQGSSSSRVPPLHTFNFLVLRQHLYL